MLLVGKSYNKNGVCFKMSALAYVINGFLYRFADSAYVEGLDTSCDFVCDLGAVRDSMNEKLSTALLARLQAVPEDELRAGVPDREEYFFTEGNLRDALRENFLTGEAPVFSLRKVGEIYTEEDVIRYILEPEAVIEKIVNTVVSREGGSFYWGETKTRYAQHLAAARFFDAHKDNLSDEQKAVIAVRAAVKQAKDMGAKTVTISIIGHDSNISPYIKRNNPDFSIEGKEVIGKIRVDSPIDPYHGLSTYDFKIVNLVLEGSSHSKTYLDKIMASDVEKVTYGKKVLYKKTK